MNNSCDPIYTAAYDNLIKDVFHFSFEPWVARNLWDERYESYSIIENGKMLANVSIFKTDMLVNGQPIRAHQYGAVATRKSERGKGLSRLLMNHTLNKYPDTPAFLGANETVIDFYPHFGFKPVQTYYPEIDIGINNSPEIAVKCHPDDEAVQRALHNRQIYSNILDSVNTQPVQICQMLTNGMYRNHIYFLPGCEAVTIAAQEGDELFLAEVIPTKTISMDALAKELPFQGVTSIEFGFNPDWLGINPRWEPLDEPYFIKGKWNLPEYFRFPALSET